MTRRIVRSRPSEVDSKLLDPFLLLLRAIHGRTLGLVRSLAVTRGTCSLNPHRSKTFDQLGAIGV
jgi:hypothetical protein